MAFSNPYIPQDSGGFSYSGNFEGNQLNTGQGGLDFRAQLFGSFNPAGRGFNDDTDYLLGRELRGRGDYGLRDEPVPLMDISSTAFQGRDRGREREREQRDMRSRDDRDRGRDRERRRSDFDRDKQRGDWSQDRDSGRPGRFRDRSGNRDRSPVHDSSTSGDRSIGSIGSDSSRNSYYDGSGDDYDGPDGDRGSSSGRYRGGRDSDHRGDSRSGDDKGGDKWVCVQPSRTIILRGMDLSVDEKIIAAELMMLDLPVKDIRLIRKASGVSRGFAFVEFHNIADAQRWMEHTQGRPLMLLNQYRAVMAYSMTRERQNNRDSSTLQRNDWVCIKCLGHNFKRRDYCRDCNFPRKESEKGKVTDGQDEVGQNPCNTLIFRGLDALTTEEGLVTSLTQAVPSPLAPIKNVAVIRDDLNTSRGFGFIEFHSVTAATHVLEELTKLRPPWEVDGKQLLVNYAKNTFNTTMATIQQQAAHRSQYYDSSYYQNQNGQYYDPVTQQYYDYSQYYAQTGNTPSTSTATNLKGSNTTNAAAAVAQAAIQQAQAVKNFQKQIQKQVTAAPTNSTVTVNDVEYPVYPPPDTSTYQYDETSGYYYDPSTQLYYDASSQYYYNSTTGQYMYWDAEKSTYLPAPTGQDDSQGGPGDDKNKKDGKDKKDKEKVKIAKKIAKDMEKWAKSMNAQKEAQKDGGKKVSSLMPPPAFPPPQKQESATADAGFAMLQKVKEEKALMLSPLADESVSEKAGPSSSDKPGLVASYGGDSDSGGEEEEVVDETKLVDWTKLACLLCKRQFQSKEMLSKHIQLSSLHKQNLEALGKMKGSAEKIEYRDRAKERRQKYGAPGPPEPRKRREDEPEAPPPLMPEMNPKQNLGEDNIGNKLLQKMGWSEGQGLGKANQGRTDPVEAKRRNQMAGLGARGATIVAEVGDNYRDALKKTMYARYNEME